MARGGKRANAGRKPGSRTRVRSVIEARLAELGCDPIEGLARIATDPKTPVAVRARVLIELAGFVTPKLSAITHSGGEEPIIVERPYLRTPEEQIAVIERRALALESPIEATTTSSAIGTEHRGPRAQDRG